MSELPASARAFAARKEMSMNDLPDGIELEIRMERARQDAKFGIQDHDPFKFCVILGEEVGEVNKAVLDAYEFKTGNYFLKGLEDY